MYDDFGDLQELYQQVILDHSRSPRNFRSLEDTENQANGYNPLCGDQVTVFCKLEDDRLADVSFQGKGCAICTASASMMTQNLKHKTVAEVDAIFEKFHEMVAGDAGGKEGNETLGKLNVFAGVRKYPIRVKCATLPWHTLKASLQPGSEPISTE